MQDAYTTSDYFPYAVPYDGGGGLNYIRNSVKVVVDAYNGSVDLYLADPSDPIAATYQRIFPGLFKAFAAMPQDLQRHIRYPEDLFLIQAHTYAAYHMEAPEVFYNREDLWQFPRQPADSGTAMMTPYYMIMRLPGEHQAENILMLPMVPSQRENMIAWLAARCDPPHYGELIVYEFPKDKLVYGPFQIEARINQNTAISQQLSLWNQLGSRVIRGNLHVIPIEQFHSVRVAVVSARIDGTDPGAQARDRCLWRPGRHGGNARSGAGGSVHGTNARLAASRGAIPRLDGAPGSRPSPGGSQPLPTGDGAAEGGRLAGLWSGIGSAANGS